jgi:hypothetical protein
MQKISETECEVCGGEGFYPIIDKWGKERSCITCPECFGSGEVLLPESDEPEYEHLPSTASKIKSMDELRLFMKDKK